MPKKQYSAAVARYHAKQAKILKAKLEQQQKDWQPTKKFKRENVLKVLKKDEKEITILLKSLKEEGFEDDGDKKRQAVVKAISHTLKKVNDWVKSPTGAEAPDAIALALALVIAALIEKLNQVKNK